MALSIYRVDFLCPACGKWHGACPHFQFQDGPNEEGSGPKNAIRAWSSGL